MIIIRVPMILATGFHCSTIYLLIFVYPLIARHDKKKNVRFSIRQWSNMVSTVYNILYVSFAQENV